MASKIPSDKNAQETIKAKFQIEDTLEKARSSAQSEGSGENGDSPEQSEKEFDKEEAFKQKVEDACKELYKRDRYLPAAIALRTALRVFGFLAEQGHFDYWHRSRDNYEPNNKQLTQVSNDLRAVFLLALMRVLKLSQDVIVLPNKDNVDNVKVATTTATFTSAFTSALTSAHAHGHAHAAVAAAAAAQDVLAAAFSAFSASAAVNVAAAAAFSAAAAADAADAADAAKDDIINAVEQDLLLAQSLSSKELLLRLLWPISVPGWFNDLHTYKFKPALENLANEQQDSKVKQALQQALVIYENLAQLDTTKNKITQKLDAKTSFENDSIVKDALNRQQLVSALQALFSHKNNSNHLTVGLLGYWGSGKTRILNLLKERLFFNSKEDKIDFIWGEFNAWAYEHTDNIQAGMAHEIIQALTQYRVPLQPSKTSESVTEKPDQKSNNSSHVVEPNYWQKLGYRIKAALTWQYTRRIWFAGDFVAHKSPFKMLSFCLVLLATMIVGFYAGADFYTAKSFTLANLTFKPEDITLYGGFLALLFTVLKSVKKLFAQPYTKELLTYVKLPSYSEHLGLVSEMRKDIQLLCQLRLQRSVFGNQKRLVFVVDDLDRCSPEGIVKTLEAVRLILDIPGVTVILAVDQRIALAALAYHYREIQEFHTSNDAKTIARDYLGKIIHLPINIPEPDLDTVTGYMSYVWQDEQQLAKNAASTESNTDSKIQDWKVLINPEKPKKSDEETEKNKPAHNSEGQAGESDNPKPTENKTDAIKLNLENIVNDILKMPTPEKRSHEQILEGYTPEQKAAFVYWTNQFQLTNPRQLKRLHNSYNLLQLVSEQNDEIVDTNQHLAFGYLITLITLEFINNLTQLELSGELKSWMFNLNKYNQLSVNSKHINQQNTDTLLEKLNSPQLENTCKIAKAIIEKAAQHFFENSKESKLATKNQIHQLYEFVNAFVLPAIEVEAKEK
ncbi:KAP family P-loop NTPase fold protein [Sessilibacter sp. MAH2]